MSEQTLDELATRLRHRVSQASAGSVYTYEHTRADGNDSVPGYDAELDLRSADRIEALEAIVEKLPKTADGVPVVPGMELWGLGHDDHVWTCKVSNRWEKYEHMSSAGPYLIHHDEIDCYSTYAAAETAKEGATK